MSIDLNKLPAPVPSTETLGLLKQLSSYMTRRAPLDEDGKFVLNSISSNQQDKIRLVLSVLGAHKTKGLSSMLRAIDSMKEKMFREDYIQSISGDPEEMRKHLELFRKLEESDIEFLRAMCSETSEKQGFSSDPKQQFNVFFNQGPKVGATTLPEDMGPDSRRKVMAVLNRIMALAEDRVPPKPEEITRVIDVEHTEPTDDRSQSE